MNKKKKKQKTRVHRLSYLYIRASLISHQTTDFMQGAYVNVNHSPTCPPLDVTTRGPAGSRADRFVIGIWWSAVPVGPRYINICAVNPFADPLAFSRRPSFPTAAPSLPSRAPFRFITRTRTRIFRPLGNFMICVLTASGPRRYRFLDDDSPSSSPLVRERIFSPSVADCAINLESSFSWPFIYPRCDRIEFKN